MNVNFTVFIDKILSGEKRQTIRKDGKKWKNVKVGDKLTLYTGLRTKDCRKLGEAEVESIVNWWSYGREHFYLGATDDEDLRKNWDKTLRKVNYE